MYFAFTSRRNLLIYLFIVFVRNFADDLFQQVFESDDAFQSSVFVDYEAKVRFLFLQLSQDIFEAGRVDHEQRRLHYFFETKALGLELIGHYIFAMHKANHVINGASVHRKTRIPVLFESLCQFIKCAIAGNCSDGCSGHHSLAHESVGKLEDPMYQATLFWREDDRSREKGRRAGATPLLYSSKRVQEMVGGQRV